MLSDQRLGEPPVLQNTNLAGQQLRAQVHATTRLIQPPSVSYESGVGYVYRCRGPHCSCHLDEERGRRRRRLQLWAWHARRWPSLTRHDGSTRHSSRRGRAIRQPSHPRSCWLYAQAGPSSAARHVAVPPTQAPHGASACSHQRAHTLFQGWTAGPQGPQDAVPANASS